MKSVRLTKQGIPDLNNYGPRKVPAAPVAATPAAGADVPVLAVVEAVETVTAVETVVAPAV